MGLFSQNRGAPVLGQYVGVRKTKTCGIYSITSPSGNFYIGSSVDVRARWAGHKAELKSGKHHCEPLQFAAHKYGIDALKFELLAECPEEHLRELEQLVIDVADPEYNASRSTYEALTDLWRKPEFRAAGIDRAKEQARKWREDPEWRRKQSEGARRALTETHKNPEFAAAHKVRAAARLEALVNTPEGKIKAAEARRAKYANDPEAVMRRRENMRRISAEARNDPEIQARVRQASRERMKAMRADPAMRAKLDAMNSARTSKRVRCIETGQEFPSAKAAGQSVGLSCGRKVSSAALGKTPKAGGFTWEYC